MERERHASPRWDCSDCAKVVLPLHDRPVMPIMYMVDLFKSKFDLHWWLGVVKCVLVCLQLSYSKSSTTCSLLELRLAYTINYFLDWV